MERDGRSSGGGEGREEGRGGGGGEDAREVRQKGRSVLW